MLNILERSINLGLGLFSYSREKIEEIVDELVEKGDVSKKDAQSLVSSLVKRGKEQREEFKKIIKEELIDPLDLKSLAKKEDLIGKAEIRSIIREEIINMLNEMEAAKKTDTNSLGKNLSSK